MSKVRKRTWVTRAGEEHTAWVADYHAPGPDGKKAAAHENLQDQDSIIRSLVRPTSSNSIFRAS
jgi:hypothetical protein